MDKVMRMAHALKQQLSDKSVLTFSLLTIITNFVVWMPYPFSLLGFLLLFLPGWGILLLLRTRARRIFQTSNMLEDFALSGIFSVILFPLFVMTPMIVFGYFPLKVGSLVLLDLILILVILFYRKREKNIAKNAPQSSMRAWKIFMVLTVVALLCFDVLYNYKTFFQTIPNSTFIPWDNVLFLRLTQEFRFGTYPPPALCNLPFKVETGASLYFLSPTFVFHSILLELTNVSIIPYAIVVSSYLHLLVVFMFFLVTKDIFGNLWVASLTAFWLSFSSDIIGLISPFSPYRGVSRPVLAEGSFLYYPVTTSSVDLTARGFYSAPAYLLIALILALLLDGKKYRSIGFVVMLLLLINPIQVTIHRGILGIFLISLTATLLAKLFVRRRIVPDQFHGLDTVILIVLVGSFLIFGIAIYFSLGFSIFGGYIQVRTSPLFENSLSILAYFGVALPLSLIGLISVAKQKSPNLSSLVIANWAIIGFLFASFVDLHITGFIDNSPIHFSWYTPMIILAGLGFAKLASYFYVARKNCTKKLKKPSFDRATILVPIVLVGIVFFSFATTKSIFYTDLAPISRDYYGTVSAYSWLEDQAYSWITDHTSKTSIFLVSPSHWWFSSITGRQVVYTRQYNLVGTPNELEIEKQVDAIFRQPDTATYIEIIEGVRIDFVCVGPSEKDRYGYDLSNKFSQNNTGQNNYFTEVFSNSQVTIFATPKGIESNPHLKVKK